MIAEVRDYIKLINKESGKKVTHVVFSQDSWNRYRAEVTELTGLELKAGQPIEGADVVVTDSEYYISSNAHEVRFKVEVTKYF